MKPMIWSAAAFAVVLALPAHADIVGKARVIDGDTIEINGRRIDLYGIDAPETGQTCTAGGKAWSCGREAAFALAFGIGNQWVRCAERKRGGGGDVAAVCYVGPHGLGAILVSRGWALADRPDARDYVPEEDWAKAAKPRIWRGRIEPPWEWRRARR